MNSTPAKSNQSMSFLSRLNQIYIIQYMHNKRIVLISHFLQLFCAFITVLLLTFLVNFNFHYGFYLLPVCVILSVIQIIFMLKGNASPAYHWIYQLISFGALFASFLTIYLYVYNPTFSQSFSSVENCQLIEQREIVLKDDSYHESYQVLTLQFDHNGETYKGCGCGSNKYHESLFQTKIEPFRYVSNSETDSLNSITLKEDTDISAIKMPSWICSSFQDYEAQLKKGSIAMNRCYFNNYGDRNQAMGAQNITDYCSRSSNFFQVILEEEPYFPLDQFILLLGCSLMPLFGLSFNWIFIIILHSLCPFLRANIEQSIESAKSNTAKVAPNDEENKNNDNLSVQLQQSQQQVKFQAKMIPPMNTCPNLKSEITADQTPNDMSVNVKTNQGNTFFTLPTAKKRVLPPISVSFNYQNAIKEDLKLEIEKNKNLNLQPQSKSNKQNTQKETFEVIVSNQYINPPSKILKKLDKTGQPSKKAGKVQFKESEEESSKFQNPI